jgi:tetratricopeptide (TPR) repeat protein
LGADGEPLTRLTGRMVPTDQLIESGRFYTTMNRPRSIFVSDTDGSIVISDTRNNRVLIADADLNITMVLYMPTERELGGEPLTEFIPISAVADSSGRVSVVAQNINNGILMFDNMGLFVKYIGAPPVTMNPFERFMRQFMNEEQRAQLIQYVPTEYNNIRIDHRNFIWGTIDKLDTIDMRNAEMRNTSTITPIKKLNAMGNDILKRKGTRGIWGDMSFGRANEPSRIIDVGIGPYGVYTMLDRLGGRMFTFNDEGHMLYAFGNNGDAKGNFKRAISIGYIGEDIVVADAQLVEIVFFEPTLYGALLLSAERFYMAGEYEDAYNRWADAAEQNSNFRFAFNGLGNAMFNQKKWELSMAYYQHAGDRVGYSKAKDMMRKEEMDAMFPYISAAVLVLAVTFMLWMVVKNVRRYAASDDMVLYDQNRDNE